MGILRNFHGMSCYCIYTALLTAANIKLQCNATKIKEREEKKHLKLFSLFNIIHVVFFHFDDVFFFAQNIFGFLRKTVSSIYNLQKQQQQQRLK